MDDYQKLGDRMMKKKYTKVDMEIIEFETEDVITTSPPENVEDGDNTSLNLTDLL